MVNAFYNLEFALDLTEVPPKALDELRWHLGLEKRSPAVVTADVAGVPVPFEHGRGYYRDSEWLFAEITQPGERGWRIAGRQEIDADELDSLARFFAWLAPWIESSQFYPDGSITVAHFKFSDEQVWKELVLDNGRWLWDRPSRPSQPRRAKPEIGSGDPDADVRALRESSLKKQVWSALSSEFEALGFTAGPIPGEGEGGWFTRDVAGVSTLSARVFAGIHPGRFGGLCVSGGAGVMSPEANEILLRVPLESLSRRATPESIRKQSLDSTGFSDFKTAPQLRSEVTIFEAADIPEAVRLFHDHAVGPVSEWFAQHDSLDKLITVAKTPTRYGLDNINPRLFRNVVALCVANDRMSDAAALMNWYRGRDKINALDSFEQAAAFDAGLATAFPAYSAARAGADATEPVV
ncbi:hypothetical protein [Nocardia sp. NPDC048505]|uniref:hypothetical protein n=1 Tax=unclassified Nocardia TaxID=2637762 RepID=UPI003408199A